MRDRDDSYPCPDARSGFGALPLEHGYDVHGRAVAEELTQSLLVIADAVLLHQSDDVGWSEARQSGPGEVRVLREKILGAGVDVGEIAAAATRDQDLFANAVGMVEQDHAPAALPSLQRAHQTGGASAEYDDVGFKHTPSRCEFSQTLPGERVAMRQTPPPSPKGVFWGYVFYFLWHVAGYCL